MKLIGLSLSFCIRDIVTGVIAEGDVIKIISGCKVTCREDLEEILPDYKSVYWQATPVQCTELMYRMFDAGKLEFSTAENKHRVPWIAPGRYVRDERDVIWMSDQHRFSTEELERRRQKYVRLD